MRLFIISCLLFASALAQTEQEMRELADELELIHLLGDPLDDSDDVGETALGDVSPFDQLMKEITGGTHAESSQSSVLSENSVGGFDFKTETEKIKHLLKKSGIDASPPNMGNPSFRSQVNKFANEIRTAELEPELGAGREYPTAGLFGGGRGGGGMFGKRDTPKGYQWSYGHGYERVGSHWIEGWKYNHPPPLGRSSAGMSKFLGRRRRS